MNLLRKIASKFSKTSKTRVEQPEIRIGLEVDTGKLDDLIRQLEELNKMPPVSISMQTDAERYAARMKATHRKPNLLDQDTFRGLNVSWFSTVLNPQGYFEVDYIEFKDQSVYCKFNGIDNEWVSG